MFVKGPKELVGEKQWNIRFGTCMFFKGNNPFLFFQKKSTNKEVII